jgi:hypothetical protein
MVNVPKNRFFISPRYCLVYALVALMPLSFKLGPLSGTKSARYVSPLDLLAPLAFLLILWAWLKSRRKLTGLTDSASADFQLPPLAAWLPALWAISSALWTDGLAAEWKSWALRAFFSYVFIPLIIVGVFLNLPKWTLVSASSHNVADFWRRCTLVLGASVGVCFLIALFQYAGPPGRPLASGEALSAAGGTSAVQLAGWYAFRGIFGAQAAMMIPAFAAFALLDRDPVVRTFAGCLAVLGLIVTLSGGALLAAYAGVLAAICLCLTIPGKRIPAFSCFAVLLLISFLLPNLPRDNATVLSRSLALFSDQGANLNDLGSNQKRLAESEKPTARTRRAQAVRNVLEQNNPLLGVGAGQLQTSLGSGTVYHETSYPKPALNTDDEYAFDLEADEPASFPLIQTIAGELGLIGLLLFLSLPLYLLLLAAGLAVPSPSNRNLKNVPEFLAPAAAALGALIGMLVVCFFHDPWVRGCGGTFAFFAAMIVSLIRAARDSSQADVAESVQ